MKTIMTLALALLGLGLYAQTSFGEIKGTLFDEETNEPIPFANVYVISNGNTIGATTDLDGKFTIKPLPAGTYDVTISTVEYGKKILSGLEVKPDEIAWTGDVTMVMGNMIDQIDISANKLINPEETSKVNISADQIKNSPVRTDINKMVAAGNSNLTVSEDGNEIYFRGSRNGDVLYLVDGVKMRGKPSLPSSGIGKMAVYTGGVPAKYGDTMGGVIVIESKSFFDLYYESKRD
ncbi:TonB-dependent receptor [Parvicella tangerina]|uniref:TonB-dependent receptor plug domain-containing protein n=1 Tax=Parvicella tangerina TaxID=2829795 RepID=A0A916JNQ0_9FLAO|nr:TonB-dependent receptor [Parvicella tangerina]CAG5084341.1 hypothetical protein CRYO30217_02440 [Parvicella tangerina]